MSDGLLRDARTFGAFAFFVGFLAGIAYGIGGAIYDVFTVGWNTGTWLALNAVWAMPFLFAPVGVVAGILWHPIRQWLPGRFGGQA